jgi:hypothetical protein
MTVRGSRRFESFKGEGYADRYQFLYETLFDSRVVLNGNTASRKQRKGDCGVPEVLIRQHWNKIGGKRDVKYED